jgi:hypothetical protein
MRVANVILFAEASTAANARLQIPLEQSNPVKLCSSPFFTMPAFFAPTTALAFSAVLPGLGNFTSNVLLILPMICMIGTVLPFSNLHHPHLYINLSRKVLLLYLPGRQQPVEQNRQAEGVHRDHDAPVVRISVNIV